ncbi:uncharacterized protein LOC135391507 [Ornithodoros turicata]|uniref:uncharacterized protein LOC135391507 n=1 Tax=Ornithodoros turicata TaxID=34597 RepID=UPI003138F07E
MAKQSTASTVSCAPFAVRQPEAFNFDNAVEWESWIQEFDDYRYASGLSERTSEAQVRTLLYTMGRQARKIFSTFQLSEADAKDYEKVKEKFYKHFLKVENVVYESACFHRRSQEPTETVDQYMTCLHTMADRCKFGDLKERMIRNRFILGLRDTVLSESLQMDSEATASSALAKARLRESILKQQQDLHAAQTQERDLQQMQDVDSVHKRKTARASHRRKQSQDSSSKTACIWCGGPAYARVLIKGFPIEAKVDSGAEVCAVPASFQGIPQQLGVSREVLKGPSGQILLVIGKFTAEIAWKDKKSEQCVYVIDSLHVPLSGLPALEALGIVKFVESITPDNVEKKYAELFHGLGTVEGEHTIRLKNDATPYALYTASRIPIPLRAAVRRELDKMEKNGVIRPVEGPTAWCAGIVPVVKPSGNVRICVDLTKLNASVLRERYTLPTVEETLGQLGNASVFSKLNANSGFYKIKLSQESQELTTFITPFGRYRFTRMRFGITSAPEYFQKKMAEVLSGLPGVVNMMDDILVYGKDAEEHDRNLHKVLQRIAAAGVTLNKTKCKFKTKEISFLGYVVNEKGIGPIKVKLKR